MSTSSQKLLVVLGATGSQGNSVAKYILKNLSGLYRVRAITRDSTKPTAQELAGLGAEVVNADFEDEQSMVKALEGANAIFAITNFWDKVDIEVEVAHGKLVNRIASKVVGLENYIFSSLLDGRAFAGGRFQNILPYNAKAAIRDDLAKYPELAAKTTELFVSYYYENWVKYPAVFGLQKDEAGTWVLSMPFPSSTQVPACSPDDTGVVVDAILKSGSKYYGKRVVLIADTSSQEELVSIWANHVNVKATFKEITGAERKANMKSNGIPEHIAVAVTELSEALAFEKEPMTESSLVQAVDIIPGSYKLKTWEQYVKEEDWSTMLN